MTVDERQVPQGTPEDLSDLLSEVRHADVLANDSCTREFLQAGERLLHDILARDAEGTPGRGRVPFDELLACVSRRLVVDEAERSWTGPDAKAGKPTESAFRYRWNTQAGYLRDLAIYSLRSRLATPGQAGKAASLLFGTDRDSGRGGFDEKIDQIAYREVLNLKNDKAFRLQMIFRAILAHDDQVANALRRVDQAHVEAWKEFYADAFGRLGLRLRPDVSWDDLAHALHAAGEGVVFRALLPETKHVPPSARPLDHDKPTSLLAKIAMAIIIAFTDPGDGEPLRDAVRRLAGRPDGPAQAGLVRPGGRSPDRPGPVDPGPWSPPAPAA
ncbi:MAG TPA: hypothetical protein VNO54_06475 [Streptosporangiaceae bacterium]|jgi:hypothetical protein|nr:hypothetical protein [Streptosporangiaceae bacterium]